MKPKIRYELKDGIAYVNIETAGCNMQSFSMGISIDVSQWDQRKQICGDPGKQAFLVETKKTIGDLYIPGRTPDELWSAYMETVNSSQEHTIEKALTYILAHKKMSKATRATYQELVKKGNRYKFGHKKITTLTAATIRDILQDMREGDSLAESSVYMYYSKLSAALTFYMGSHGLEAQGKIDGIMKAPHINKGKIVYKDESYLEDDDIKSLMRLTLNNENLIAARLAFLLQCYTGMAKADVFAIKDLSANVQYVVTGDQTEGWFKYVRKKTGKECKIPVTKMLEYCILARRFPIAFSQRTYNKLLGELGEAIGKPISSHTGRHTFGVIFLNAGFSIETVSKMMGHSSIHITENCYAKITEKRVMSERDIAMPKLNSIAEFF